MQHIINAKDRNRAFLQFFVLFLLTTALVIAAVYFNFQLPLKENRLLANQNDIQLLANQKQQKFINKVNEVNSYLDSLEKEPINASRVGRLVESKLKDLEALRVNETAIYEDMNSIVINDLFNMKRRIENFKTQSATAADYQKKYDECMAANVSLKNQVLPYGLPQQTGSGR